MSDREAPAVETRRFESEAEFYLLLASLASGEGAQEAALGWLTLLDESSPTDEVRLRGAFLRTDVLVRAHDYAAARGSSGEVVRLAERIGSPFDLHRALGMAAVTAFHLGDKPTFHAMVADLRAHARLAPEPAVADLAIAHEAYIAGEHSRGHEHALAAAGDQGFIGAFACLLVAHPDTPSATDVDWVHMRSWLEKACDKPLMPHPLPIAAVSLLLILRALDDRSAIRSLAARLVQSRTTISAGLLALSSAVEPNDPRRGRMLLWADLLGTCELGSHAQFEPATQAYQYIARELLSLTTDFKPLQELAEEVKNLGGEPSLLVEVGFQIAFSPTAFVQAFERGHRAFKWPSDGPVTWPIHDPPPEVLLRGLGYLRERLGEVPLYETHLEEITRRANQICESAGPGTAADLLLAIGASQRLVERGSHSQAVALTDLVLSGHHDLAELDTEALCELLINRATAQRQAARHWDEFETRICWAHAYAEQPIHPEAARDAAAEPTSALAPIECGFWRRVLVTFATDMAAANAHDVASSALRFALSASGAEVATSEYHVLLGLAIDRFGVNE